MSSSLRRIHDANRGQLVRSSADDTNLNEFLEERLACVIEQNSAPF
jgi:hypothetical protein